MRTSHALALLALCVVANGLGSAAGQTNQGYVGVYRDAAGTLPCASVPQYSSTTLYVIAKTAGESANGISGAEFRIEVTNPAGWYFSYIPPTSLHTLVGEPLDTSSSPGDNSGANISFPSCMLPSAGNINLGTINVFNLSGTATDLLVRQHNQPSNPGFNCPLFVLCNGPTFSKRCMTPSTEQPCMLSKGEATGSDGVVFTTTLNADVDPAEIEPVSPHRQVIAMFKRDTVQLPIEQPAADLANISVSSRALSDIFQTHEVLTIAKAVPNFTLSDTLGLSTRGEPVRLSNRSEIYVLTLASEQDQDALVSALRALKPEVVFADPNGDIQPGDGCAYGAPCPATFPWCPNDEFFEDQWSLHNSETCGADISALEAWKVTKASPSIILGVVDYDIDMSHEELVDKAIGETNERIFSGHGTNVASIAAANTDNQTGIAGVAPYAQIAFGNIAVAPYPIAFGSDESADYDLRAVAALGAQVVNTSWTLIEDPPSEAPRFSTLLRIAFRDLYMENRAAVVIMGNTRDGHDEAETQFPAGFGQGIIAVGATDEFDNRMTGTVTSNIGPHIDVVAPGKNILMATPRDCSDPRCNPTGYRVASGTSFAAPHVAGLAGLLLGAYPYLDNDDLENVFKLSADPLGAAGCDEEYGCGRINAENALSMLASPNQLFQSEIESYPDVSIFDDYGMIEFVVPPAGLDAGQYRMERYELRKQVTFPVTFVELPHVWGRGWKTRGFNNEDTNFAFGWCDVVPGSVTTTGCVLRTYAYKLWSCEFPWGCNDYEGWFPAAQSAGSGLPPKFAYSVLGELTATDVGQDATARTGALALTVRNPAHDNVALSVVLPRDGQVEVGIFDVAGRRVGPVFTGFKRAGRHELLWKLSRDGERLPSGLYFARVMTDGGAVSTKLVVLR